MSIINNYILEGIKDMKDEREKTDQNFDYYLQLPFINEGFTRQVKKALEKSNLNVRVVCKSGQELKSMLKPKSSKLCNQENCHLCTNDIPCKLKHFVYEFTRNHCTKTVNTENNKYIGASRRVARERLGEHEQAVRKFNTRTTLGQHMVEKHSNLKPSTLGKRTDFKNLFTHFTPKILSRCKDSLATFVTEGLAIKDNKPSLNNCQGNGFL